MKNNIVDNLYDKYKKKGYISEENIFEIAIENNVSLDSVDYICEMLLSKGVIIENDRSNEEDDIADRSRTDYNEIYKEIIGIDNSLKHYIEEIRAIKPPQNLEWKNLMLSAKNGNEYSRERIIMMHMRLVVKIALWHCKKYRIPLADAIQIGNYGLVVAFEKYNIERTDHFSQYASMWIRQYIMREAELPYSLLYYPAHYKEKLFSSYERVYYHNCEGCNDDDICQVLMEEIKEQLNCTVQEARAIVRHLEPMYSIENILEYNEEQLSDKGMLEITSIESMDNELLEDKVSKVMESLIYKESKILRLRFGIEAYKQMTLDEISKIYGVTRERIRQIEAKAMRRLKVNKRLKVLKENYL